MTRAEEIADGTITLTPTEYEMLAEVCSAMVYHRDNAPADYGFAILLTAEQRDLLHLVLLCGVRAIETGMAAYKADDTNPGDEW